MSSDKFESYSKHPDFSLFYQRGHFPAAYFKDVKYLFPFRIRELESLQIMEAREKAIQAGAFVEAQVASNKGLSRFFLDAEYGMIRLLVEDMARVLVISGAIFNPQKGEFAISELVRLIHMLSEEKNKSARYETYLVNKTDHLKKLLEKHGFSPIRVGALNLRDEYEYQVERE